MLYMAGIRFSLCWRNLTFLMSEHKQDMGSLHYIRLLYAGFGAPECSMVEFFFLIKSWVGSAILLSSHGCHHWSSQIHLYFEGHGTPEIFRCIWAGRKIILLHSFLHTKGFLFCISLFDLTTPASLFNLNVVFSQGIVI